MPSFRGHLLGYFFLAAVFLALDSRFDLLPSFELWELAFAVAVGGVYAVFADVDSQSSNARKYVEIGLLALVVGLLLAYTQYGGALLVKAALFFASVALILWFLHHRGVVHSIFAAVFLSAPLFFVHPLACGFAFLGYVSHLILDGKLL
jgi:hypothetical protein